MTDTITLPREVVQEWHDRIKASSNFNDRESLKMYDLRQEIAAALAAPQPAPIAQPELLKFLWKSYQTGTYATLRHALGTAISAIEGSATVKVEPQPVKQSFQQLYHKVGYERYEKLRKLNAHQFAELYRRNIAGERFDDMVDELPGATQ